MTKTFAEAMRDARPRGSVETLHVILGDQLSHEYEPLKELNKDNSAVLMMEVAEESEHAPSHRQRTVLFLSAMRHFAKEVANRGYKVRYTKLEDDDNEQSFSGELKRAIKDLKPKRVTFIQPGEWRVREMLFDTCEKAGVECQEFTDTHFYSAPEDFLEWREGRKNLVMEYWYREMRKKHGVLMTQKGKPAGGDWNFDKQNRKPPGSKTPDRPEHLTFKPDEITKEVIEVVEKKLGHLPGRMESFGWPVTRAQAKKILDHFIEKRLSNFGPWQDAMITGEPWMFHAVISPMLNLKLLDPREAVDAAVQAYDRGDAKINCVEGFVRQIIGWREFIRGVYWTEGKDYGDRNFLKAYGELPDFYWGESETDMNCMRQCLGQVIEHGYGHHIQRLMVTGNFALIAGVHPREASDWYLAMYVDAVDWVTLPNTAGMIMHADGGMVGTKPYAAGGNYINKMSDYCKDCRYNHKKRTGEDACPFTNFYWDFLLRNEETLRDYGRMGLIMKNLDKMDTSEKEDIRKTAQNYRREFGIGGVSSSSNHTYGYKPKKKKAK